MSVETLSVEDIKYIHESLVREFSESPNPICPPGVKSENLLASAVFRQHTSLSNILKYPDSYSNAATLTFGICCDHPFHNGNKRTALVALLAHLYKNRLSFDGVGESNLYNLVIDVSTHNVTKNKKRPKYSPDRPIPDEEVTAVANWIKANSRPIQKGERQITYRELGHILEHFGFRLYNPKGNAIEISRMVETYDFFLRLRKIPNRIGSIRYPGDKVIVSVKDIKYVRHLCKLTAEDGVDSETFYEEGDIIDAFIIQHRGILQRLANK
jgi:death on curing protein